MLKKKIYITNDLELDYYCVMNFSFSDELAFKQAHLVDKLALLTDCSKQKAIKIYWPMLDKDYLVIMII